MLEKDITLFLEKHPDFKIVNTDEKVFLEGTSIVSDSNGVKWDEYKIKISISIEEYPHFFPILNELEGKIPQNPDWHTFPDGTCCVAVRPIINIEKNKGISLERYYKTYVIPYLANQTYRKLTGKFADGEFSHGVFGIYEYYKKLFNSENLTIINLYLKIMLQNKVPSRTNKCFCGSEKKYRHCHREIIQTIISIGIDNVIVDLEKFIII